MKRPRSVAGSDVIRALERAEFTILRQSALTVNELIAAIR